MKFTKKMIVTIALILSLTLSAILVTLPVATAHDPPWNIKTYTYVSVAPNPIGVNQEVLVYMWLSETPPTAAGPHGDRWHTLDVEVVMPDGTTETLGPFVSDPVGGVWIRYLPIQVGTYTFQATFGGETLAGDDLNPTDFRGRDYIGDYYEPSQSDILSVTVQQDPIPAFKDTPLPDSYWKRPIDAQHRNWWQISGNWLGPLAPESRIQPYSEGPETAHILWTKELIIGGLIGGGFGSNAFHGGSAYEAKFTPPIIIAGTLYINKYPNDIKNAGEYRAEGPKPGVIAIDIRTGEEIWYYPNMSRINFGQVYNFNSMNQHGAFAYLWSTKGSTWTSYEAYTGDYVFTIENVPGGTQVYGPNGEILRYTLDKKNDRLTLWDNTAMPELRAGLNYYEHMWRPHGKIVDAKTGYMWNVSIPADLEGKIEEVLDDRIIGSSGLGRPGWTGDTEDYTVWALSLKPGEEGKLLWKKEYTAPYRNVVMTMTQCPMSLEDGVFTVFCAETREWFGYDVDNGNLLWGPTEPQDVWDIFYETAGIIAYGKLYSSGVSGILYCYDVETGNLEWSNGIPDPTWETMISTYYPLRMNLIADGKVYTSASEHSPNDPKPRGAPMACFDAFTGEKLWEITMWQNRWGGDPALADGILITVNAYDNQLYSYGKGPSATTVTASPKVSLHGSSILIEGTVTDISPGTEDYALTARFPNGVPAVSDESMSEWMHYLYMQFPCPYATGVPVTLEAVDPNGNYQNLGTVTTDVYGNYGFTFEPEVPGQYMIIATFYGSDSYYASTTTTYLAVDPAPAPAQQIEPELTEGATSTESEFTNPDPTEPTTASFITTEIAILVAVVIASIIGVISFWALRKRK